MWLKVKCLGVEWLLNASQITAISAKERKKDLIAVTFYTSSSVSLNVEAALRICVCDMKKEGYERLCELLFAFSKGMFDLTSYCV